MFKIVCCVVLTVLALNANAQSCDTDLLWWARADVFKPSVTQRIGNALTECHANIASRMDPVPCANSCNELICNYNCAVQTFEFVSEIVN